MWVVCRRCERWNLTPLEERWEAIEECERLFVDTRLRVSTENIGLARVADGLELVRIGKPLRPELAAWRYGDQFGRRRRRHVAYTGAGVATAVGLVVLGPVTGVLAGGSWALWNALNVVNSAYQQRRVRARLVVPDQSLPVAVRLSELNHVTLVNTGDDWALRVAFEIPDDQPAARNGRWFGRLRSPDRLGSALIRGDAALRAAAQVLPAINAAGARRDDVASAVRIIEEIPDPTRLFAKYACSEVSGGSPEQLVSHLPRHVRLALEMAAHEESERRALEGDLAVLEEAWKDAEEVAAIADALFPPDGASDRLLALKKDGRRD